MRRLVFAASAALMLGTQPARAQSIGKMLGDDFKNVGADIFSIWASPFDASKRDWALTAGAFAAFGATMLADQSVADWAVRNDSSQLFKAIKPVRTGGSFYVGKNVVPPILGVYVLGVAFKNQGMRDFVTGCMSAWGSQSVIRKSVYRLVGRDRPYASPDDPNKWSIPGDASTSDDNSFPGGHFANAAACATFWNKRFDVPVVPAVAIYAVAGAVGIGRVADGGHWASDQVLGGILGYAVGSEIARRSLQRRDALAVDRRTEVQMSPTRIGFQFKF